MAIFSRAGAVEVDCAPPVGLSIVMSGATGLVTRTGVGVDVNGADEACALAPAFTGSFTTGLVVVDGEAVVVAARGGDAGTGFCAAAEANDVQMRPFVLVLALDWVIHWLFVRDA